MKNSQTFQKFFNPKLLYLALLLVFLRIDLSFLNTLPTGGDMGAHIVPTKYFAENFFTNFQLRGWSNDWFAGYPLYYFYFPLPPLITSILNFVLPFSISFKLLTVLCILKILIFFILLIILTKP